MTNPLTIYKSDTEKVENQEYVPPVARQLKTLFNAIPETELLKSLKVYYAGRNGYTYKILWRTYVAMTILNLPSFASLIRTLENSPYLVQA